MSLSAPTLVNVKTFLVIMEIMEAKSRLKAKFAFSRSHDVIRKNVIVKYSLTLIGEVIRIPS